MFKTGLVVRTSPARGRASADLLPLASVPSIRSGDRFAGPLTFRHEREAPERSREKSGSNRPSLPMGSSNASAAATILLVEDELMVRDLMVTILTRSGHKVLVAATAAEARRLFLDASDAIDLVVTDVSLPDGDGMRLAEEFRTRRPSLKVICTSGSFAAPAGPRAEGPTLFLEKPFSAASLSQAIRQMLDA